MWRSMTATGSMAAVHGCHVIGRCPSARIPLRTGDALGRATLMPDAFRTTKGPRRTERASVKGKRAVVGGLTLAGALFRLGAEALFLRPQLGRELSTEVF